MDNLEVRVHEEINDYKEKFYGLTFRQIVSVIVMLLVDIPFYWLAVSFIGEDVAQIGILVLSAPILSIGFITFQELPMEKFARYFIRNYLNLFKPLAYKPDRKVKSEKDFYEKLGFFDRMRYSNLKNSMNGRNNHEEKEAEGMNKSKREVQKAKKKEKQLKKRQAKETKLIARLERKAGMKMPVSDSNKDSKPDLNEIGSDNHARHNRPIQNNISGSSNQSGELQNKNDGFQNNEDAKGSDAYLKTARVSSEGGSAEHSKFEKYPENSKMDSQNSDDYSSEDSADDFVDEIVDEPSTYDLYDVPEDEIASMMDEFL